MRKWGKEEEGSSWSDKGQQSSLLSFIFSLYSLWIRRPITRQFLLVILGDWVFQRSQPQLKQYCVSRTEQFWGFFCFCYFQQIIQSQGSKIFKFKKVYSEKCLFYLLSSHVSLLLPQINTVFFFCSCPVLYILKDAYMNIDCQSRICLIEYGNILYLISKRRDR